MANPLLVWTAWVLAAIVIVLSITRAPAMPAPTCEEIREQSRMYTWAQLRSMAQLGKLTKAQWEALLPCLDPKK